MFRPPHRDAPGRPCRLRSTGPKCRRQPPAPSSSTTPTNANPVGSLRALESAAQLAAERGGPLVVVTPGMVELGPVQAERNHAFGAAIGAHGARLLAVARTNRAALLAGYASTAGESALGAQAVARREQAVAEAVATAGERGVILYENDLPDHYP